MHLAYTAKTQPTLLTTINTALQSTTTIVPTTIQQLAYTATTPPPLLTTTNTASQSTTTIVPPTKQDQREKWKQQLIIILLQW